MLHALFVIYQILKTFIFNIWLFSEIRYLIVDRSCLSFVYTFWPAIKKYQVVKIAKSQKKLQIPKVFSKWMTISKLKLIHPAENLLMEPVRKIVFKNKISIIWQIFHNFLESYVGMYLWNKIVKLLPLNVLDH